MSTNKQATLLTVYELVQTNVGRQLPTFEVTGGTVNVYFTNKAANNSADPADKTEMSLDDASPFSASIHKVIGQSDFVLFETATGTPVVKTKNLIR